MAELHDNVIEWYTDMKTVTITFHQMRWKNRIERMALKYPDEVEIISRNDDGTICAHIPLRWIHITRPRDMTKEQREAAAERLRSVRRK